MDGAQFETFVVTEVVKWLSSAGRDVAPSFYRTRSGFEVDPLLTTSAGIVGIEVKNREGATRADAKGLRRLADALSPEWRGGMVVHRGDRLHVLDEVRDIWSVPAHRLF